MVQSSGILNISTLKGSYRIGGRLWVQALIGSNQIVKPALVTTSIMQKLVLCDVMVVW